MIKGQFDSKFVGRGAFELGVKGYDGLDWHFRCATLALKAMKGYSASNLLLSIGHIPSSLQDFNHMVSHEWKLI